MSATLDARAGRVRAVLESYTASGRIPGGVALVAGGGDVQAVAVGAIGREAGDAPMEPDTIVRIASITKPITAAAGLQLVDDGRLALGSPVAEWLPELAHAGVVRTPQSPLDDVVPVARPITLEDLLTSRSGWGFPPDFTLPAVQALLAVQRDGRYPHRFPAAGRWLAELAAVPMLAQPGSAWLYDTSLTILGILIERVTGRRLGDYLEERIFAPLGMADTGFVLRQADLPRFARFYREDRDGLAEADDRATWLTAPSLEPGNGGLIGTVGDWWRFARMLLNDGQGPNGRVLSGASVDAMLTNRIPAAQRQASELYLEGQGWGFGGSVDVVADQPWTVPGRYGWVGGTGTSAHLVPSTGEATILFTQVAVPKPGLLPVYRDVWTAGA